MILMSDTLQADADDSSAGEVGVACGSVSGSLTADGIRSKGCFPNSIRSLFGLSKGSKSSKTKKRNSTGHEVRQARILC
jgi:hypothetical protein